MLHNAMFARATDRQDNVDVGRSIVEDLKAQKNAVSIASNSTIIVMLMHTDRDGGIPTMQYPGWSCLDPLLCLVTGST
jgi:hypothetical protein